MGARRTNSRSSRPCGSPSSPITLIAVAAVGPQRASADDLEPPLAAFGQRIDALLPGDPVSSGDLGQWALFVIERNACARLGVADFGTVTAEMQADIDEASGSTGAK